MEVAGPGAIGADVHALDPLPEESQGLAERTAERAERAQFADGLRERRGGHRVQRAGARGVAIDERARAGRRAASRSIALSAPAAGTAETRPSTQLASSSASRARSSRPSRTSAARSSRLAPVRDDDARRPSERRYVSRPHAACAFTSNRAARPAVIVDRVAHLDVAGLQHPSQPSRREVVLDPLGERQQGRGRVASARPECPARASPASRTASPFPRSASRTVARRRRSRPHRPIGLTRECGGTLPRPLLQDRRRGRTTSMAATMVAARRARHSGGAAATRPARRSRQE